MKLFCIYYAAFLQMDYASERVSAHSTLAIRLMSTSQRRDSCYFCGNL